MSENGLNLVGLLRSLQAEASGVIGLALVLLIIYLIVRWACNNRNIEPDDRTTILRTARRILIAILVIGIVIFVFIGLGRIEANRMPRSDVDKTGVYQQMDSHNSGQPQ